MIYLVLVNKMIYLVLMDFMLGKVIVLRRISDYGYITAPFRARGGELYGTTGANISITIVAPSNASYTYIVQIVRYLIVHKATNMHNIF